MLNNYPVVSTKDNILSRTEVNTATCVLSLKINCCNKSELSKENKALLVVS